MSEDERALKAARAKALLRKRQQQKAAGALAPSIPSSPLASPFVPKGLSPAPSEPTQVEKKELNDVFSPVDSDTSWVNSLPRVGSPPRSITTSSSSTLVPSSHTRPSSPPLALDDKEYQLQNQQQTISLLVSEKAKLTAELERLAGLALETQKKETLLEAEYKRSKELQSRVHQLQATALESTERIHTLQSAEKELSEKCRDQERELQLTNVKLNEIRVEAEQHQRRVRYLEEQIQSDDRVERLTSSLKNTQDRADQLEFRLTKIKQENATIKTERERFESQLQSHRNDINDWKAKHLTLHGQVSEIERKLTAVSKERDVLLEERSALQDRVGSNEKALVLLQERLNLAASELSTSTRQLQSAQIELKHAVRRADDAERIQKDLQTEGTTLLHSLDEMRPKIVELTGVKAELMEKIDGLQHAVRSRDTVIAQLESTVDELQKEKGDADKQWRDALALRESERSSAQANSTDLQAAYLELQADLDSSRAKILALEAERTGHHQQAAQHTEEIEQVMTSSQAQWEELTSLRRELGERKKAQEEEQDFLERAQNEIESLRLDVNSKDEEIERLRHKVFSPLSTVVPRSLDDEMLNSLQQQHALDLSAAQSRNRELQTAVFEAEAKAHALQKRVGTLETQLSQTSASARQEPRALSPQVPSRPSSRNLNRTDLRRGPFHGRKPSGGMAPPSLTRSVIDVGLSPDTRHKRQISLSMLKARIDSEMAAASSHLPPSRALSPVASLPTVHEPPSIPVSPSFSQASHRPQFMDESHVFWCHSCQGDLVVL